MVRVTWLPPGAGVTSDDSLSGQSHRNREHLDHVVRAPETDESWRVLREDYQEQAVEWNQWSSAQAGYTESVLAGLEYLAGLSWWSEDAARLVVEVGAGTGEASAVLRSHAENLVVTDVTWEMLRQVDPAARRVVADVRRLPFPTASVDLIVGLNAVPGLAEFERVIAPGGRLLWCTTFGSHTPLHVDPEELARGMGEQWHGVAQRAGAGDWCLLQR